MKDNFFVEQVSHNTWNGDGSPIILNTIAGASSARKTILMALKKTQSCEHWRLYDNDGDSIRYDTALDIYSGTHMAEDFEIEKKWNRLLPAGELEKRQALREKRQAVEKNIDERKNKQIHEED
jgi:hypothetical protein